MDWGRGISSVVIGFAIAWGSAAATRPRPRLRDLCALAVALVAFLLGAVAIAHFASPSPPGTYYVVGAGAVGGALGGYGARYLAGPPRRGRVRVTKRP